MSMLIIILMDDGYKKEAAMQFDLTFSLPCRRGIIIIVMVICKKKNTI